MVDSGAVNGRPWGLDADTIISKLDVSKETGLDDGEIQKKAAEIWKGRFTQRKKENSTK